MLTTSEIVKTHNFESGLGKGRKIFPGLKSLLQSGCGQVVLRRRGKHVKGHFGEHRTYYTTVRPHRDVHGRFTTESKCRWILHHPPVEGEPSED